VDAELKTKWVEALRSGRYKQGRGCLRSGDNYCCLGVLCDVSGVGQWGTKDYYSSDCYSVGMDTACYALPVKIIQSEGLSDSTINTLCVLNDETKASFAEIADYIEANL
jgi:hypothetical protein